MKPKHSRIVTSLLRRFLCVPVSLACTSCVTTSLSDPTGRGHAEDLNVYDLTGLSANPTDLEIRNAGKARGTLPSRGARILLIQSGAHQPDQELVEAFQKRCTPVSWSGLADRSNEEYTPTENRTTRQNNLARKLRYTAAQQGCSHVVVVQGEIQKDGEDIPVLSWVPIACELLPTRYSGMRLHAQSVVIETNSGRFQLVNAEPKETRGLEMGFGAVGNETDRSLKLKRQIYPSLAEATVL